MFERKIAPSIEAGTWLNSEVLLGAIHVLYRRNAELELNGDFAFQFFWRKRFRVGLAFGLYNTNNMKTCI